MKKIRLEELSSKLNEFLRKHSMETKEFAKSVGMTSLELSEILTQSRLATEKEYAEIMIAMTIIEAKGWEFWCSMGQEKKDEIVAKFVAAGGSTMTIGGMIAIISACGVPGLSAAGIASGLAAIGALVGGGMVAGIAVCSAAPILVGGILYGACKSSRKSFKFIKKKFNKSI